MCIANELEKVTQGVCYVAVGERAVKACDASVASLRQQCPGVQVTRWQNDNAYADPVQASRWAKVMMDQWSPYDHTLYLDADTIVRGDVTPGFRYLADGWDVAIASSTNQGERLLWHCSAEDKAETIARSCTQEILQLQAGVFFFRKSPAVAQMFAAWRAEWEQFKEQDQGALLRALVETPVRIWILGWPWNGGAIVEHRFGVARA